LLQIELIRRESSDEWIGDTSSCLVGRHRITEIFFFMLKDHAANAIPIYSPFPFLEA
jgi:hypothetical protein